MRTTAERDKSFVARMRITAFWTGIAAAGVIPLLPAVFRPFSPPGMAKAGTGVEGVALFALDILGGIGDGILAMVWTVGLAAAALIASLISFSAAWAGRESRRTKMLCLLPALLAMSAVAVLAALGV